MNGRGWTGYKVCKTLKFTDLFPQGLNCFAARPSFRPRALLCYRIHTVPRWRDNSVAAVYGSLTRILGVDEND